MNLKNTFAVLLAARNGEKWIEQQINSILEQKDVVIYILIGVDDSKDKTLDIVKKIANKNKNIEYIVNRNQLSTAANNFFNLIKKIDVDKYNYFSFADQDDIWLKNKLVSAVHCIDKGNYDMYSSNVISFKDNKIKKIIKSQPAKKYDYLFEGGGPGNTIVLKKECFLNLQKKCLIAKNINDIWSHDWFIYAFVRSNKYRNIIDSNTYVYYRQHTENVIGANKGLLNFYKRAKFVLSGKALNQSRLIASILNLDKKNDIYNLLFRKKISLFYIILNISECRRKTIDRIKMILAIILLFFKINDD